MQKGAGDQRSPTPFYAFHCKGDFLLRSILAGDLGELGKALRQFGITGDIVTHLPVVELFIGHHVKIAGAGESKDNGLFLAGLPHLRASSMATRMA